MPTPRASLQTLGMANMQSYHARTADRFTHAAYYDWEREHTALRAWLDRSRSVVSCGGRLAPSCSACSTSPSDCLGDCVWAPGWITAGSCTEIVPGETLPPNLGGLSRSSSASSEPVQVVDSSPLSTALLTMVLAGAPGSGKAVRAPAYRCTTSLAKRPCQSAIATCNRQRARPATVRVRAGSRPAAHGYTRA